MNISVVRSCLLIGLLLFLGGCYESEVPMAKSGQTEIDGRLIGDWQFTGGTDSDGKVIKNLSLVLKMRQFNAFEYFVEWYEEENRAGVSHSDTYWIRSYIVMVDQASFINAQLINSLNISKRKFIYCRYSLSDTGQLTLRLLNEDLLSEQKLTTSEALYSFIRKNLNNDKLHSSVIHLRRTARQVP